MAQRLTENHSNKVHKTTVKRHIRLNRQVKGADVFAAAIEPAYNAFIEAGKTCEEMEENTGFKRDTAILKDSMLDDQVRNAYDACQRYDRDNPGRPTTPLVFPKPPSTLIYASLETEPKEVTDLVARIKALGETHPLANQIAPLEQAVAECKAALSELTDAITDEGTAKTTLIIAKMNLRRQYEQNIYNAASTFGKEYSERLFPAIAKPSKKAAKENSVDTDQ